MAAAGVVFQAGFRQAEVAGAADAGDVGGLGDGAVHPGADPVPAPPGVAGLPGAGRGDRLVDPAGTQAELAAGADRGGAPAGRAGWQVPLANRTRMMLVPLLRAGVQELLTAPCGQVTCRAPQSMVNMSAV